MNGKAWDFSLEKGNAMIVSEAAALYMEEKSRTRRANTVEG